MQSKRTTLICEQCGKPYAGIVIPSLTTRFCSRSCFAKSRVGEKNPTWRGGEVTRSCKVCGATFSAKRVHVERGHAQYCSVACMGRGKVVPVDSRKSGTRSLTVNGYVRISMPTHPQAMSNGYVLEHRLVMEGHLGRLLHSDEVVHHIDGNKSNNDIANLRVMSQPEHARLHMPKGKMT